MSKWLLPGCILIMAGCHGSSSLTDPFAPYGMRVVPPPGTGSIGTPSGYAQPPANLPPSLVPGGATSWPTYPTVPQGMMPPGQMSSMPGEGNWHSLAGKSSADLGLAPPVTPRNPYSQEPSVADARPLNSIARTSSQLNWGRSAPAPMPMANGLVVPTYYEMPQPVMVPNAPPYSAAPNAISPIPVTAFEPNPAYSTPVRPSVVR